MKKLVMTGVVLACAASIVTAQTVTSANMVGYNKGAHTGFQIIATQFDTGDNTPEGVFGAELPVGSKIYVFNGAYTISTFQPGFFGSPDFWDNALDIGQGVGYWVEVPAGTHASITSGEVYAQDTVSTSIVAGFQLVSYPYPVVRTVTQLGFSPTVGDKIYKFDGAYTISTYQPGFFGSPDFWDNNFSIGVGEGFWYETVVPATWVAARPFTP